MNKDPEFTFDASLDEDLSDTSLFEFSSGPLPVKSRHACRIFYNNINGFEIKDAIHKAVKLRNIKKHSQITRDIEQHTKVETFFQQMSRWNVDVTTLAEHCTEWNDGVPRLVLQEVGRKYNPRGMWTVATSRCSVGNYIKPGGALVYCTEDMAIRTADKGTDPWGLGRWAFQRYRGRHGRSLLVISAYRVGKRTGTPGSSTAWYQQKVLLTSAGRALDPDTAFIVDILDWLKTQQETNDKMDIALFLDANERWTPTASISKLAEELGLINLGTDGGYDFPPSHPCIKNSSRSTTIDYCLISPRILPCVSYAGMTPFDLMTLGDHRGIILDIDLQKLLRDKQIPGVEGVVRNLITSNPIATKKYLDYAEKGFTHQRIFDRVNSLYFQWSHKTKTRWEVMKKYEQIDKEIFQICIKAEKKCKAANRGKAAWSPRLAAAIKKISYWRARVKYQSENKVVKKLGDETGIIYETISLDEAIRNIAKSREELEDIQKSSIKHRKDFLELCAEQYATENNISKANAVRELISHESVRTTFALLKDKISSTRTSQLHEVWVARNEHGNYIKDSTAKKVYETKESVHRQLLRRNRKHLSQAQQTPFAQGPWSQKLKWDGTGEFGQDILEGRVKFNDRRYRNFQVYFETLATYHMRFKQHSIVAQLSLEDYRKFWKKKREDTVTSPFGLHIGHYKASLQKESLLDVHRLMLLIPFQTGLVPSRWRKTVQTMLEKDPGQPWIHRLRIIELFDAQVNAGFQIFIGRRLIWSAVQNKGLHPSSYGSTPGKMAASAILQKVLSVDQLRLECRAGGIFDCDATGCYDRIIPPLASIHLQALGLHTQIATFLARLMFMARRHVKTKHGVSRKGIRTKKHSSLYGIGQGNGGGPAIWLAHLTVMLTALSTLCYGLVIAGVTKLRKLRTVGTGYVDDVTIFVSIDKETPQTMISVKSQIKRIATKWEKLLFLTGGKLELTKCFWIPIIWHCKKGVLVIKKPSRCGGLHLRESETGDRIEIPRLTPVNAPKRLGVRFSIDGTWKEEYKHWRRFTDEFVRNVKRAKLDRLGGYHSYATLWCSKFRYSCPCVGFNRTKLEVLEKKIIGPSLAVAGYSSKMPRAVVFGPVKYGGLQWATPHSMLLSAQITMLIGSLRLNDVVGQMLRIQLEWLQLYAGIECPVLEATSIIPYLPSGWLSNLHYLLVDAGLTVQIVDTWTIQCRWMHDRIIMDYVLQHLPDWMWHGINSCRLFLQAVVISDLATEDGCKILPSVYKVQARDRSSLLDFPIQPVPTTEAIEHWQYFIRHITHDSIELLTPLGNWIAPPYSKYKYMIDVKTKLVYKTIGNDNWDLFVQKNGSNKTYEHAQLQKKVLPSRWVPVRVIERSCRELVILKAEEVKDYYTEESVAAGVFQDRFVRKVIGQFELNMSELRSLREQWACAPIRLLCGADGGLKDGIGTSGYVLTLPEREQPLVTGHAAESQGNLSSSSTRQELLAQVAVEYWIDHLLQLLGIPVWDLSVTVVTDSQASIDIVQNCGSVCGIKDVLRPEYDVASELHRLRKRVETSHAVIKVRSHISVEEAPDESHWLINDMADRLATEAREKALNGDLQLTRPLLFPGATAGCFHKQRMSTGCTSLVVQTALYEDRLVNFLMQKYGWTSTEYKNIDWDAHSSILLSIPAMQKISMLKYVHGWLATKKRQYRKGCFQNSMCFLCDQEEGNTHMFSCKHPRVMQYRRVEIRAMLTRLRNCTEPDALQLIRVGLESLAGNCTVQEYQEEFGTNRNLCILVQEQTDIGWDQFARGRVSKQWRIQGPSVEFSKDPGEWVKRLVRETLSLSITLWKFRNQLVYGPHGIASEMEDQKLQELVEHCYLDIAPWAPATKKWVFEDPLDVKLNEPYHLRIAWVDGIRKMFPEEYKQIQATLRQNDILGADLDRALAQRVGQTGL